MDNFLISKIRLLQHCFCPLQTCCVMFLLMSSCVVFGQPPSSENELKLISPNVLIGNEASVLQEFAREAGYTPSLESTEDSVQFVYVEAKTYSLAIYLDENISWIARIFTQKDKGKLWIAYLDNFVKTQPNLWSKVNKEQYMFKETSAEPVYLDIIKEDSGYKRFIIEFHH
jgi:hypothetical protein